MTSMGLRGKSYMPPHMRLEVNVPQPPGLLPGEKALVHPPAILNPRNAPPQKQDTIIRDLLQRLRQQPTPADAAPPEPAPDQEMKSVLRK